MALKHAETKPLNVVTNFFSEFKNWIGTTAHTPTAKDLEKFLSKNLQMFNNGQLVVQGSANYLNRLQRFRQKYAQFEISEPLEEPITLDNRIALYYRLDLTTHNGQHSQVFILGLITIQNDKIEKWVEVTHEKGQTRWDT